jgi:hypothetical protein
MRFTYMWSGLFRLHNVTIVGYFYYLILQLGYLEVTVQEKLKFKGCCDWSFVCFQCEQTSQVQL